MAQCAAGWGPNQLEFVLIELLHLLVPPDPDALAEAQLRSDALRKNIPNIPHHKILDKIL